MQQAKMNHAYCVGLNPGWKKIRFQLALNKTFRTTRQTTLHPPTIKATPMSKEKQKNAFCTPSLPFLSVFHTKFTISEFKSKQVFHYKYSSPPVLESSTRISKFYAPTDSEHEFNKTEIENWLTIE